MANHFHMLIEVQNHSTSEIMQRLLTSYTKYFNKIHNKNGHLFQSRYKAILCDKDAYLLELVRYIHLNPVRAGIVKEPSLWKWSGHNEYIRGDEILINGKKVLGYFDPSLNNAVLRYSTFVNDGIKDGPRNDFYPIENSPYLGNESFIKKVNNGHENDKTLDRKAESASLEAIADEISKETGVPKRLIQGRSRSASLAEARKRIIENSIKQGHRGVDIARFLNRTPAYIVKIVNKYI